MALEEWQGWVGTPWSREGLLLLCNFSPTSSCKPTLLGWKTVQGAGSSCMDGVERGLCKVAGCRLQPKKWKCFLFVSL